ncbi:MAG: hypothetical protein LWW86_04225 [Micrococcales bacterium]|nr:hypothetical protein [Micrococcales bacterium]
MNIVDRLLIRTPTRWLVALAAAAVAILVVCGVTWQVLQDGALWIGLDTESRLRPSPSINLPALTSGLVLIGAGFSWLSVAPHIVAHRVRRQLTRLLGGFLIFMGLDEVFGIHEDLGGLFNTDWQIVYLPIIAVGGVGALGALSYLWSERWRAPLGRSSMAASPGPTPSWSRSSAGTMTRPVTRRRPSI